MASGGLLLCPLRPKPPSPQWKTSQLSRTAVQHAFAYLVLQRSSGLVLARIGRGGEPDDVRLLLNTTVRYYEVVAGVKWQQTPLKTKSIDTHTKVV